MAAVSNQSALRPRDRADLIEILRTHPRPLELVGGGTKRGIGRPMDADALELSAFSGIVAYEPAELVLTAGAATPLAAIEAELARHGQRLAFEPPDFGPLLEIPRDAEAPPGAAAKRAATPADEPAPEQTLGGVLAANLAGSRRISCGAARDHFLGFEAVSGDGVPFKAGGGVVKNVTGYDLPKLLAGSWGTLAALLTVTIRVAPAPETEATVILAAGDVQAAVDLLARGLGSPHDVSAAAFVPTRGAALRIEGFAASVAARVRGLLGTLGGDVAETLTEQASHAFWQALGAARELADAACVVKVSVPPSAAPRVVAAIDPEQYVLDWGGGLIWAAYDHVDMNRLRSVLTEGHATLWKAPRALRAEVPVFHPQPPALERIAVKLKQAFDPADKLCPGRMGVDVSRPAGMAG